MYLPEEMVPNTMNIKHDHPAYPFREEPEGSCQRGGTFTCSIHSSGTTSNKLGITL